MKKLTEKINNHMGEPKNLFIEILKSTERQGIEELINYIEENRFFNSPATTQKHFNYESGLVDYAITKLLFASKIVQGMNLDENCIQVESLIIVCLLDNVAKASYYQKPNFTPNILKNNTQSTSKPWEINKDISGISETTKSLHIISKFIELTQDEAFSIYHKNGAYGDRSSLQGNERPLQIIANTAEMLAINSEEGEKFWVSNYNMF